MRIARVQVGGEISHALVEDGGYRLIEGDVFGEWSKTDTVIPVSEARLMAPIEPKQIVAIGLNYRQHAEECGMDLPQAPVVFIKTPNTVVGPDDPILLPAMAPDEVDFEAELVIVIGKSAKRVTKEQAHDYVLGYTCGNDVSARDCQLRQDKQWARGKSFDTFAPIGPWIETDLDGDNAGIKLTLKNETMQDSNTSDLIFSCMELVSYLSECMTLYPGSIIMTGTPSGIGFTRKPPVYMKDGDSVTVAIEGIGELTNPVRAET